MSCESLNKMVVSRILCKRSEPNLKSDRVCAFKWTYRQSSNLHTQIPYELLL